jgi:predicted TIM-barrel enzyme
MDQAMAEAVKILAPGGAHGLILVNNGFRVRHDSNPTLGKIALEIKHRYTTALIGINPLDLDTVDAVTYTPSTLDMLWTDIGGIKEENDLTFLDLKTEKELKKFVPKYWGSELFKVGEPPIDPEAVAQCASKSFDAFITSGTATGISPDVKKIKQIRQWIGVEPLLGIASGMSPQNVHLFLDYADIFIVATSLCVGDGKGANFWHYDSDKIKSFRSVIDQYEEKTK